MDIRQKAELERLTGERIEFDYPMGHLTTFQVGGPAEAFWKARDLETLKKVMAYLSMEGIPYGVLGRGSNLLIKDEGIDGVMILLTDFFATINDSDNGVWAGGGVHLAELLRWCRRNAMGGLEFLAGIPGTVGGAVIMNAGAFGQEINERIQAIQWVTPWGMQMKRDRTELNFSYRRLHLETGNVVTNACFSLDCVTQKMVSERMGEHLKIRKQTQPLEYPNAGSVFKNPPGDFAGRLIEKAGLKGKKIGGAMISEKHANFIVNKGGATAKDILTLMDLVRMAVKRMAGVSMETEIRVLGK